jgi:hypothetical protein
MLYLLKHKDKISDGHDVLMGQLCSLLLLFSSSAYCCLILLWLYSPLLGPGHFFSFIICETQSVGLFGRRISPSQGRHLHTGQHKHRINAYMHPCLEWDSNPRSQLSSERRKFMPYTALGLLCDPKNVSHAFLLNARICQKFKAVQNRRSYDL